MDKLLENYLGKHNIKYKPHEHPPIFTVEESKKLKQLPGVTPTKNLFLRDEAHNLYLVCMYAYKKPDLKNLKEKINAVKKLTFASSVELKEHLNLTPGSVSIFGMIHAKNVKLILDKKIWEAEKSGFHPNINTATLELNRKDLEKFYNSLSSEKTILEL